MEITQYNVDLLKIHDKLLTTTIHVYWVGSHTMQSITNNKHNSVHNSHISSLTKIQFILEKYSFHCRSIII